MKFQVAQSLLVALYKLNATEMKAMLSVLPKNFQVRIRRMSICVVKVSWMFYSVTVACVTVRTSEML